MPEVDDRIAWTEAHGGFEQRDRFLKSALVNSHQREMVIAVLRVRIGLDDALGSLRQFAPALLNPHQEHACTQYSLCVRLEPARALQVLRRPVQRIRCVVDQAAFGQRT